LAVEWPGGGNASAIVNPSNNVGLGATPTLAQRPGKSKQVNLYPAST
jgi:hypothetical protein